MSRPTDVFFGFETAETEEKQESCVFLSVTVTPSNADRYNVESGVDNFMWTATFMKMKKPPSNH
ncbi:hypothetical protein DPMN_100155 [Dreissena polymorpha]|uniref:Uncharacterized protein n=1 Tax=Dreissena polymorpha TaxID=45954 RepID=A0A9D4LG94_DREPO|nr:hypothetical protein DPMN_100155 [Dreissena polymorpha]